MTSLAPLDLAASAATIRRPCVVPTQSCPYPFCSYDKAALVSGSAQRRRHKPKNMSSSTSRL